MPRQLTVNYQKVYDLVSELKATIDANITEKANTEFTQVRDIFKQVDGATNFELLGATLRHNVKAREAANVLLNISQYIERSAKAIEREEARMAMSYTGGGN